MFRRDYAVAVRGGTVAADGKVVPADRCEECRVDKCMMDLGLDTLTKAAANMKRSRVITRLVPATNEGR